MWRVACIPTHGARVAMYAILDASLDLGVRKTMYKHILTSLFECVFPHTLWVSQLRHARCW